MSAQPLTRAYVYKQAFSTVRFQMADIVKQSPSGGEFYRLFCGAAFTKCLEFCEYSAYQSDKTSPFFATATLRGICDDLIVLRFLRDLPVADANQLLQSYMLATLSDSLSAQQQFFSAERPAQKVPVGSQDLAVAKTAADASIVAVRKRLKWEGGKRLPSTAYMARQCGLKPLYELLFAGTSKWVHFSPIILARMGWGPSKNGAAGFTFSTANFGDYYWSFNLFWGAYLLVRLHEAVANAIGSSAAMAEAIADVEMVLNMEPRWPELITPEELNIRPRK